MRILLSFQNQFVTLYRTTLNKNLVVGWYSANHFFDLLTEIPGETIVDVHFTYPRDGNFHKTYKYYDVKKEVYTEKRVYYDKVVVKFFTDKSFQKFIGHENRERNLSHVSEAMIDERHKKWTDSPFEFSPGGCGYTFKLDSTLWREMFNVLSNLTKPTDEDIVIDLESNWERQISLNCFIYDKLSGDFKAPQIDQAKTVTKRIENESVYLELFAIVF